MNKQFIYLLEIFLIIGVPLATVGFDFFESTSLYKSVFNLNGIEDAIRDRFSTQYNFSKSQMIYKDKDREVFYDAWTLIKSNTLAKLPNGEPFALGRLPMKNSAFVELPPNNTEITLVPEGMPIMAWYIYGTDDKDVKGTGVMVGTLEDFKRWYQEKQRTIRIKVNIIITLISIGFGIITLKSKEGNTDNSSNPK